MNLTPINPYTVNKIAEERQQKIEKLEAEVESLKARLATEETKNNE